MKYRAICTDIDGTLLDRNRQLSPFTLDALRRAAKDVPVILASSRMPSAMTHLQKELDIVGSPLIAYNGGYVVQYRTDGSVVVFDSHVIPAETCESILSLSRGTQVHMSLYFEDNWYAPRRDEWTIREESITKVTASIADPIEVVRRWKEQQTGAHKIMCMGPEEQIKDLQRELTTRHGNSIHVYFSRPTYLELAPNTVSKGSALALVMKENFGMELSTTMAFGDNFNDIDMIRLAGWGVAVANARDEVKDVANEITTKSTEDGVAHTVSKYFL